MLGRLDIDDAAGVAAVKETAVVRADVGLRL